MFDDEEPQEIWEVLSLPVGSSCFVGVENHAPLSDHIRKWCGKLCKQQASILDSGLRHVRDDLTNRTSSQSSIPKDVSITHTNFGSALFSRPHTRCDLIEKIRCSPAHYLACWVSPMIRIGGVVVLCTVVGFSLPQRS